MLNRLDLRGQKGTDVDLPRPHLDETGPIEQVRAIIAAVRARGDDALREYGTRFDGVEIDEIEVPHAELEAAIGRLDPELYDALHYARDSIEAFHRHRSIPPPPYRHQGMTITHLELPVARAGVYVPGGRASYPSSVLMTAIPARVAGVAEVVACVPPRQDGSVAPEVLAAASLAGVDHLYRVGGAQAIAAMAYGTQSVLATDVIVGPGNKWVSLAQREVRGVVGVPSAFAGPSEVVVIADDSVDPELAAIDVIVQAEHGPDGLAWLVTWSDAVATNVAAAIERLVARSPRKQETERCLQAGGYVVLVEDVEHALQVSNAIAPEHLELLTSEPESHLGLVRNAGAVFLGARAPASVGDYVAGPSHVLPTHGTARFASVLGIEDFLRRVHAVALNEEAIARLAPMVAAIAQAEGLVAHAESARLRLGEPTWSKS